MNVDNWERKWLFVFDITNNEVTQKYCWKEPNDKYSFCIFYDNDKGGYVPVDEYTGLMSPTIFYNLDIIDNFIPYIELANNLYRQTRHGKTAIRSLRLLYKIGYIDEFGESGFKSIKEWFKHE